MNGSLRMRAQLSVTSETIRPIHYLGSKLRILDFIGETINNVDPSRGTVCDLFSGSGTVSQYLGNSRRVISIDIQEYSRVLCSALLSPCLMPFTAEYFIEKVKSSDNYKYLFDVFSPLLSYEKLAYDSATSGNIEKLYDIIENGSIITTEINKSSNANDELSKILLKMVEIIKKEGLQANSRAMVIRYFGGLYFSYEQALCIDAVLETVFQYSKNDARLRDTLMASVISATSDIVNTIGKQFAQPLQIRDSHGRLKRNLLPKILNDRAESFMLRLSYWIHRYSKNSIDIKGHEFIKADYRLALKQLRANNISVVYADPPYTRYHYSRYYHVLETICLRDMPEVSTTFTNGTDISRGIYRKDRHQSPFSIKSKASGAFDELFFNVSNLEVPLVLSYSPFSKNQPATPRMMDIDQLVVKAKQFYKMVDVVSPGYFTHSKLNAARKNFGTENEAELLLVCR